MPGTTAASAPSTTASPAPPSTSLPTPTTLAYNQTSVPACKAVDLSAAASTDLSSYPVGMTVNVVVVVANQSAVACAFQDNYNDVTITDQSGATVYPTTGLGYPGCPNGVEAMAPTYLLEPGESFDAGSATWDQRHHSCSGPNPGARYPSARYMAAPAVYGRDGQVTATKSAPFQLV